MSNTRLTVVVRRDLQLSPGLLAAQVAHMSDQFMRKNILAGVEGMSLKHFTHEQLEWMEQPYLSVLAVNTLDELRIVKQVAQEASLLVHEWVDVIPSEVLQRPIQVLVGISIGPADFDKIKLVTGTLPLF